MNAVRRVGWLLLVVVAVLAAFWGALALHFSGPRPALVADALAAALVLATVFVVGWLRPLARTLVGLAVLFGVVTIWWSSLEARNDRDWQPDVARTPRVLIDGDKLTVENLRNFDYRSETDYTERWETRTFDLARLNGLDFFMSYWGSPSIAHTIMSWDFDDGQHLAISIETRKEKGEEYSAVKGFFKQFELYYVVADERDIIRLRTNYRKEEVHLYMMRTPLVRARKILMDYVASINELAARPAFYNAATQNCTTTIFKHVKHIGVGFPFDRRVIINGRLDELLYEQHVIDVTHPFPEVRQMTLVNARAQAADQDPAFSERIRVGLVRPPFLVLPPGST